MEAALCERAGPQGVGWPVLVLTDCSGTRLYTVARSTASIEWRLQK